MSYLSLSPMVTTNALGSFGVQSDGYVQGITLDDPANRFNLSSGTVAATETKPFWGGLSVAKLSLGNQLSPRGPTVRRVVSAAELESSTVSNQTYSGLTTLQSSVPLYASGMSVPFYCLGSNMCVPLEVPAQVVALATSGVSVKTALAQDLINNQITIVIVAGSAGADIVTTALVHVSGMATATTVSVHGLTAGQYVKISGAAPLTHNDIVVVLSVSGATAFIYTPATAPGGAATTQDTIGVVTPSDIILSVKVLAIKTGNSKTIICDSSTGFPTWNNNDSYVLVLL